jgi:hypothetical protein
VCIGALAQLEAMHLQQASNGRLDRHHVIGKFQRAINVVLSNCHALLGLERIRSVTGAS